MNDVLGAALSIVMVFLIIAITTVCEKSLKFSKETSRKLIHIGVGHWIFFAYAWIDSKLYAAIPLILFIILNALSLKNQLFASMETTERKTFGTVYYPISLLILTLLFFKTHFLALAVGVMALAWGDGMAAMIGSKFGKKNFIIFGQRRTVEGSVAMFIFSSLSIGLLLYYVGDWSVGLAIRDALLFGAIAAIIEAFSYRDWDNLLIPILVSALFYFYTG